MLHFKSWNDFRDYGIDYLTGESCAYGYRGLCDLTERGIKIVASCFGLDPEQFKACLPAAWNSGGVKSIMLAHQMLVPLAVFACWNAGCSKVYIMYDDTVVGVENNCSVEAHEEWVRWNQGKFCEACRRYGAGGGVCFQYSNPGFSRHQHQMSGRTE